MAKHEATCTAPVNIAVIKYWGKRAPLDLILPTNSSLSVTLSQEHLRSKTSIRADPSISKDRMWLNGKEEEVKGTGRMANCLRELRSLRKNLEKESPNAAKMSEMKLHIVSRNNFPTAAGLASSASGFAALVFTLATLFELQISPSDLSRIARQGSGSACRSLFGGFVAWEMGSQADGSDSLAVQVAPLSHWPSMQALICVVSDLKKGTSSTAGMQRTVETSPYLQHRIQQVVPGRMQAMRKAILSKTFDDFAQITMADSNSFHACCLDTEPPIFYMNDTSRLIVAVVVELNRASVSAGKGLIAAYTFDAGPNAVIYAETENMPLIIRTINHYFPQKSFNDRFSLFKDNSIPKLDDGVPIQGFNDKIVPVSDVGAVKELIHTAVGEGPQKLHASETLINADGMPLE